MGYLKRYANSTRSSVMETCFVSTTSVVTASSRDAKLKLKTKTFVTRAKPMEPSLANTCFLPLENESSSLKGNSMQLHVKKLCRGGRWYLYLAVPHRQESRSKGISSGSRAMQRLCCSSTMTMQAVKQRRKRLAYYHRANARSLRSAAHTRMPVMHFKQMTLRQFVRQFGTRNLTVLMGSSTENPFLK